MKWRFNPCFSGSCSRIHLAESSICQFVVSILVLVDLARESMFIASFCVVVLVSILVLVDLARELSFGCCTLRFGEFQSLF